MKTNALSVDMAAAGHDASNEALGSKTNTLWLDAAGASHAVSKGTSG